MVCGSFGFVPGLTIAGKASAAALVSGSASTVTPDSIAYPPGAFILSESDSFTSQNGLFTGALTTSIFKDSVTGDYDFIYQLQNTTTGPADSFDRLSLSSFGPFSTDVDYSQYSGRMSPRSRRIDCSAW